MCNSTDTLNGADNQSFSENHDAETARNRLYALAENLEKAHQISAFLADVFAQGVDFSEKGALGLWSIMFEQEKRLQASSDCLGAYMDTTGLFISADDVRKSGGMNFFARAAAMQKEEVSHV